MGLAIRRAVQSPPKIEVWRSAHDACAYILPVTSVHVWRATSIKSMGVENLLAGLQGHGCLTCTR